MDVSSGGYHWVLICLDPFHNQKSVSEDLIDADPLFIQPLVTKRVGAMATTTEEDDGARKTKRTTMKRESAKPGLNNASSRFPKRQRNLQ